MSWAELERSIRDDAYASITNDPEFLFEHDGGPYGIKADLIYARLIGFDDQIVEDGWRLSHVQPDLRLPIRTSFATLAALEGDVYPSMRAAKYVLQSNWATTELNPMMYVSDCPVKPGPPDFLVRLLYLRYRRRE